MGVRESAHGRGRKTQMAWRGRVARGVDQSKKASSKEMFLLLGCAGCLGAMAACDGGCIGAMVGIGCMWGMGGYWC